MSKEVRWEERDEELNGPPAAEGGAHDSRRRLHPPPEVLTCDEYAGGWVVAEGGAEMVYERAMLDMSQ